MTGGTPYLATDSRALRDRFQKILEDLKKSRHPRSRHCSTPSCTARFLLVAFALLAARDRAAPHPFPEDSLMRFVSPHALWLLLAVPAAVIAYGVFFGVRRRRLARLGDAALVERMTAGVSMPRKLVRAALMVAALGLTALALARPQFPGKSRPAKQRGLDLVVALDFSRSMLATRHLPVAPGTIQARARASCSRRWATIASAWSRSRARR